MLYLHQHILTTNGDMKMLRGKRAVITGGGGDLDRRCACGWHEKVSRWIFARGALMIFKTPAASSLLKAAWQKGISVI